MRLGGALVWFAFLGWAVGLLHIMSCLGHEELELSCMVDAWLAWAMSKEMSNDDTRRYTVGTAGWPVGNDGTTSCAMYVISTKKKHTGHGFK